MTRSGRPASLDPKIAAPIRLRKSTLDEIRAIGGLQEFAEAAILKELRLIQNTRRIGDYTKPEN
jgi:hypothetical protein